MKKMKNKKVDEGDLFDLIDFAALDYDYAVNLKRYNPELSERLAVLVMGEVLDEKRTCGKVISLDFYRIFGRTWSKWNAADKSGVERLRVLRL